MRENAFDKARPLLAEGRLTVRVVGGSHISAVCRGDSAKVYSLGFDQGRWFCSCPAVGRCAHATALMLVTLEPGA
jgi:uncharacterized Zn finger protein